MATFHSILGTSDNSTKAEVKARYRKLSSQCHPDKGGSNELFKLIGEAYEQVKSGNGNGKAFTGSTRSDPSQQSLIDDLLAQLAAMRSDLTEARGIAVEKHNMFKAFEELAVNLELEARELRKRNNKVSNIMGAVFVFLIGAVGGSALEQNTAEPKVIYKDVVRRVEVPKYVYTDVPVEKIVYKDKIIYKDRIIYKDKIIYKEAKAKPSAKPKLWKVADKYIYTEQKGGRLLYIFSTMGMLKAGGVYTDSNDGKFSKCTNIIDRAYLDGKSYGEIVTLGSLKEANTIQCNGESKASFSLSGFTAAYNQY